MGTTRVTLTEPTFILGSLLPAGTAVDIDLSTIGLKTVDDTHKPDTGEAKLQPVPLAPNLVKAPKGAGDDLIPMEIAAIAPTGPNPDKPQSVPAGAVQVGESYVAPAEPEADAAGSALTPETPAPADKKGK